MTANSLKNAVAIVTGAGHPKGIGAAIATALREEGATVITTDIAGGDEMVDVTDTAQIQQCVAKVIDDRGRIDILVNNAGVGVGSASLLEQTEQDFDLSFNVNVRGMFLFTQAVIPHMRTNGGGSIVNVASLSGLKAIPAIPPLYTASKFAAVGLTKAIAQEFGSENIRCNAVCPGSVDTQMRSTALALLAEQEGISVDEADAAENATIALGRPADSAEVASLVAYLCSPAAAYMTGAAIPVDGAMAIGL